MDDLALELEVDGKTHVLRLADFTGADDLECYRTTGFTLTDIFVNDKITLFTLAALVWLKERKVNPKLTYEAVNEKMSFNAIATLKEAGTGDAAQEGEASPE